MPLLAKKGSSDERRSQINTKIKERSLSVATASPSRGGASSLLSPQTNDAMLDTGMGCFSTSTPPLSRQRRHSKLHLRVASEICVDQTLGIGTANSSGASGNNNKDRYRIVIMGSSAVGKTAIVEQFLYGSFPTSHSATVEELHKGEYEVGNGAVIPLEILDTSGSYEFPAMRRLAISAGDAFALIYSIDNSETFEEVKRLRETIVEVKGETYCPIVVVGNKSDLPDSDRTVGIEMAECECIDWDHGFVECSAKDNRNIMNIFSSMLIQARLKGCLNVNQIVATNKHHHSRGGDHGSGDRMQRRRSSLPISELFHRSQPTTIAGLRHQQNADPIRFRKRNSCTPS
ncbi:GTP-binding protein drn-1-like [Oppia nitens]|uniref:GTP-binding protein drn-1-like n=1 Tax=Oppia nitens TaxID=1686743 RepID=UPI0023DAEFC3|nr:GTP-binding protein drn-1-like [Oppia nitens]